MSFNFEQSWIQVRLAYNLSGENLPPFGCLATTTTTEAFGMRYVGFLDES